MLRLVANKARDHYNVALEHAERGRTAEAIDELHNAIDLDRSFTVAHVVLGTLYAKAGNFDKARDSWRTALEQQPELVKAHQYLQRVETVEKSLPALWRLRAASIVLLGATILLGFSYLYVIREKPETRLLRQAQEALAEDNYGRTLDLLQDTRRQAKPGSPADIAASALQNALQSELRQEVRHVQDLKYREAYPEVLSAIAALEARRPDEATSAVLTNIREDVNHYYATQLRYLFDEYREGRVAYSDFLNQAGEFLEAYPDLPEKTAIAAWLDQARELEAVRRFDGILAEFLDTGDIAATVEQLRAAQDEFGGTEAAVAGRAEAVDQLLTILFEEFQRLVDAQNYPAASDILSHIEQLSGEFRDVVDVRGPVNLARQVLQEVWTGARLKEIEQLVRAGDPAEAREALMLLSMEEESLAAPARELLARLELELAPREDLALLEELRADRKAILEGGLNDTQATQTYALAVRLADTLREPARRSEALGYAAGSAAQAGNYELAADLLGRARKVGKLESSTAQALQKLIKAAPGDAAKPKQKQNTATAEKPAEKASRSSSKPRRSSPGSPPRKPEGRTPERPRSPGEGRQE